MKQLTLRVSEQLAQDLKRVAGDRGESVNSFAAAGLEALVDPSSAGSDAERFRERLRRAGLLTSTVGPPPAPPDDRELASARAAAGRGRPLSDYVDEGRGPR